MLKKHPSVHISEKRRSLYIKSTEDLNSDEFNLRTHLSEEFLRYQEFSSDQWSSKYHYMLFCILIGSNNNVYPLALKLALQLSGGAFLLLLLLATILICLPIIYMETFLGRYTRLTNGQMYRMAPIYFGVSVISFLSSVTYQPLHIVEDSEVLVSLLKLLVNPNFDTQCLEANEECYDYKIKGPLNDTCKYGYMSMICENHGLLRYPKEYQYWKMYKDPQSALFPYYQIITTVIITWGFILGMVTKGIYVLGPVLHVVFVMHFTILTIIYVLALAQNGSTNGLQTLLSINFSNIDIFKIIGVMNYSMIRTGIIVPTGYMSYSAYAKFDSSNMVTECLLIVIFSILLGSYYIVGVFLVCGVLAHAIGVSPETVLIPETGIYLAVIPEFLVYVQMPNIFILTYYGIVWLFESVNMSLYIHFIVLNLFDYFPATKNFAIYIWVIACTTLCLATIPTCTQYYTTMLVPIMIYFMYFKYYLLIAVTLQTTMTSYIYGVNRLCDDIHFMSGQKVIKYFSVMWYLIPVIGWVAIFYTLQYKTNFDFGLIKTITSDDWAIVIFGYWFILALCILFTIMYIIFRCGTPNLLLVLLKPQFFWGPSSAEARIERKNFCPQRTIRSQLVQSKSKQSDYINMMMMNNQLVTEFSKNILQEQIKKGGVVSDKSFLPSIGIYSETDEYVKYQRSPAEAQQEIETPQATK